MAKETVCKFCGKPVRISWRGVTVFECGSASHHIRPQTEECWRGFVWKLQERVGALESMVQVCPGDLAEAVRYTAHLHLANWWKRLKEALPKGRDSSFIPGQADGQPCLSLGKEVPDLSAPAPPRSDPPLSE